MAHQTQQGGPLGDVAISLVRTGVPLIWGYAAAWLISLGLPAPFLAQFHDLAVNALGAVLTFAWYAAWRWAEVRMPRLDSYAARLAVVIALGHPKAPVYAVPAAAAPVAVTLPVETKAPPAV